MSEKRRGLGRGLGALIPTSLDGARSTRERPVDVFFPELRPDTSAPETPTSEDAVPATSAVAVATEQRPVGTDGEARVAELDTAGAATVPGEPADPAGDASESSTGPSGDGPDVPAAQGASTAIAVATSATKVDQDGALADAAGVLPSVADGKAADGVVPTPVTDHLSDGRTRAGVTTSDASPSLTESTNGASHGGTGSAGGHPFDGLHGDLTEVPGPRTSGDPVGDTDLLPVPGAVFAELPLDEIRPNPRQPRTVFDEEALDELVGSIREIGVLQPVVVRRAGDGYELIMGERRWRAAGAAGLESIPAIIRETGDEDLLRDALLENLHRSQLNPLEEAAAYQQLLDDFGCTHDELATRLHRSRPQISNTLRLLKLPPLVQRRVAAGVLSAGHARALLGLADGGAIERLAQRIVAEGLSVRAVEEIVALGGDGLVAKRRAAPRAGVRNEALDALAGRLSDRFETRVKVALGKSRGRLTVEFASVQDLNRILSTLAPEDPGLFHG